MYTIKKLTDSKLRGKEMEGELFFGCAVLSLRKLFIAVVDLFFSQHQKIAPRRGDLIINGYGKERRRKRALQRITRVDIRFIAVCTGVR